MVALRRLRGVCAAGHGTGAADILQSLAWMAPGRPQTVADGRGMAALRAAAATVFFSQLSSRRCEDPRIGGGRRTHRIWRGGGRGARSAVDFDLNPPSVGRRCVWEPRSHHGAPIAALSSFSPCLLWERGFPAARFGGGVVTSTAVHGNHCSLSGIK